MTRIVKLNPPLPEFAKKQAREYFIAKKTRQIMMTFEKAESPEQTAKALAQLNASLQEIARVVKSPNGVHGDFPTLDDIKLFPKIWEIGVIKGAILPQNLQAYLDNYLKLTASGGVAAFPKAI